MLKCLAIDDAERSTPLYPPIVAPPVRAAAIDGIDNATTKKIMVASINMKTIGTNMS